VFETIVMVDEPIIFSFLSVGFSFISCDIQMEAMRFSDPREATLLKNRSYMVRREDVMISVINRVFMIRLKICFTRRNLLSGVFLIFWRTPPCAF
jgi:hypothetical protein